MSLTEIFYYGLKRLQFRGGHLVCYTHYTHLFSQRVDARYIKSVTSLIQSAFQQASESLSSVEQRLAQRNMEVLSTEGREAAEHEIEREFERIHHIVEQDLS